MINQGTGETLLAVALPVAGFTKVAVTLDDRTTSLRKNLIDVTVGPVYFLTVRKNGTAPDNVAKMHALPAGAVEREDGTLVVIGDLYVHAPAPAAGTLKLVTTT